MVAIPTFLLNRFKEASTIRAILSVAAALGLPFPPEVIIGIVGLIHTLTPDTFTLEQFRKLKQDINNAG